MLLDGWDCLTMGFWYYVSQSPPTVAAARMIDVHRFKRWGIWSHTSNGRREPHEKFRRCHGGQLLIEDISGLFFCSHYHINRNRRFHLIPIDALRQWWVWWPLNTVKIGSIFLEIYPPYKMSQAFSSFGIVEIGLGRLSNVLTCM